MFQGFENAFPVGEYAKPEWKEFLKNLGMTMDVEPHHLVAAAKKISDSRLVAYHPDVRTDAIYKALIYAM